MLYKENLMKKSKHLKMVGAGTFTSLTVLNSLSLSLSLSRCPSLTHSSLYFILVELSEFVFQLDEEIEAMQATLLHLEHQVKSSNLKEAGHGQMALTSPNKSGGSRGERDRDRDRTARGTPNGPLQDTHSTSNGSSLSSKVVSRSQT